MTEYIELNQVEVLAVSDKAVLVKIEGEDDEVWFPFSQVEDNKEGFEKGYEGPMYVTEWIAEKKGIL